MAKFDVFNGKIDEPLDSEKTLNTWYDDLLWCPSQCYYYFMHGDDIMLDTAYIGGSCFVMTLPVCS